MINKITIDDITGYSITFRNNEYTLLTPTFFNLGMENTMSNKISERTINGKKYISFEALGMSKKDIKYETEFINKDKEMYINITGEYNNGVYGIKRKLDVNYKVDTDVYDAFKVVPNHGFVTLILYEKKNEQPMLKDLGKKENSSKTTENNNIEDIAY